MNKYLIILIIGLAPLTALASGVASFNLQIAPSGTPEAQVIIHSIIDNTVPSIVADVTITNESTLDYEYLYEWCVVSQEDNECGGGDDVFASSASKFILANEDFNTNLNAIVPDAGDYWFKLIVYWDDEESGSYITFTAEEEQASIYCGDGICNGAETCSTCPADCGNCGGGPGGGGPGGGGGIIPPKKPEKKEKFQAVDFSKDGKVNLIDFSIFLCWWGKANAQIDLNNNGIVDLADFSILLCCWTG